MIQRVLFMLACGIIVASGQPSDLSYEPLNHAYEALKVRAYDEAISYFRKTIDIAPGRAAVRKDLGYTYLKVGENELARDQFRAAMEIDPTDNQVAMEFAFLAYESKQQVEARRVFDRIRKTGGASGATAEQAFQNIDRPLAAGIERWLNAIAAGGDNFSAHFELATLAEQRDELALAAEHYEKAWRLLPDRYSVLVDLGRVWKAMKRTDDAMWALLAASRGGEPRAAEMARELLPDRYPFVPEFEGALKLDPGNVELRRELAYLLLRMQRQPEAEEQFQLVVRNAPGDLLAATQLGFLLDARGERAAAQVFFDRVLAGGDDELANRVRAVLRLPQVLRTRQETQAAVVDAKVMAERSMQAGYVRDGLKYLEIAHEADPGDFEVMLKLGWAYNILHDDRQARRWFDLARRSPDPQVAAEAAKAWRNLADAAQTFRTTVWLYPIYSTRWDDVFSYGQVKTELRKSKWVQPYVSVRFDGDARVTIGGTSPASLSESSFIVAAGIRTAAFHGVAGWFEGGSAISYLTGHMLPDYRGGFSGQWRKMPESAGWFVDTSADALYISRFDKDYMLYSQSRAGYAALQKHVQLYWNGNFTLDTKRQYWANFAEMGPGVRVSNALLPRSMWVSVNAVHGVYLTNLYNPGRPNFNDLRVGVWYAFTSH